MRPIFLIVVATCVLALPSAYAGKGKNKKHHGDPRCASLKEACQRAGFKKGSHGAAAKGLFKDCMDKLIEGQKVKGVAMDPKDPAVGQCRTFLTSTPHSKAKGGKGGDDDDDDDSGGGGKDKHGGKKRRSHGKDGPGDGDNAPSPKAAESKSTTDSKKSK